jgi:hypothetical protein
MAEQVSRVGVMRQSQRYGVSELAGTPIVIDTEAHDHIVARCRRADNAMMIARALNAQGAVDRIKALRGNVDPTSGDEREAAYARGYLAGVTDALDRIVGGQ